MTTPRWHPVASASDLPHGHVYQTRLEGQGLALWRSADGTVNVWEDRCPHRGVRLSIGTALNDELQCQYHAWRFASETGACVFIPAHPSRKPAAAIHAKVWPALERGGLVWTGTMAGEGAPPEIAGPEIAGPEIAGPEIAGTVLRAIPVNRPALVVEAALTRQLRASARLFVQPVEAERCVIRGVANNGRSLRSIDARLEHLRRGLEAA